MGERVDVLDLLGIGEGDIPVAVRGGCAWQGGSMPTRSDARCVALALRLGSGRVELVEMRVEERAVGTGRGDECWTRNAVSDRRRVDVCASSAVMIKACARCSASLSEMSWMLTVDSTGRLTGGIRGRVGCLGMAWTLLVVALLVVGTVRIAVALLMRYVCRYHLVRRALYVACLDLSVVLTCLVYAAVLVNLADLFSRHDTSIQPDAFCLFVQLCYHAVQCTLAHVGVLGRCALGHFCARSASLTFGQRVEPPSLECLPRLPVSRMLCDLFAQCGELRLQLRA